jgi:hypothetical protein
MNAADRWFEVSRFGLSKLLERRSPEWIVYELAANAFDTAATAVDITLERVGRVVRIVVTDDDPDGFVDLTHAYTLYGESPKKGDPTKRGRFDRGEKLVLARCDVAEIASTTGTVRFDGKGRHRLRRKLAAGSRFTGEMRMTVEEYEACLRGARLMIPPRNVATRINGEPLPPREPLASIRATLPTEFAGADGVLRRSARQTVVEVYEPRAGETPTLYEMGLPVVETGDRYHYSVQMRVPLSMDRDNVTPGYLAQVRAVVLEHMADHLDAQDVNETWVKDAMQTHGADLPGSVVERVLDLRFGDRRVAFDPSDIESNARAVAAGYTVVYGSQMSREEWDAARRTGTIQPAGRVTPTPKPFSADGKPLAMIDAASQTPAMRSFVGYVERIGSRLIKSDLPADRGAWLIQRVVCDLTADSGWRFAAAYDSGHMIVSWPRVEKAWAAADLVRVNDLLIHEISHHLADSHLSEAFYMALSYFGAKLTQLALDEPALFDKEARDVK